MSESGGRAARYAPAAADSERRSADRWRLARWHRHCCTAVHSNTVGISEHVPLNWLTAAKDLFNGDNATKLREDTFSATNTTYQIKSVSAGACRSANVGSLHTSRQTLWAKRQHTHAHTHTACQYRLISASKVDVSTFRMDVCLY